MSTEVTNDQSTDDIFERIANGGKPPETKEPESEEVDEQEADSLDDLDAPDDENEPKHKVVVDGQEFEVPLKELVAGYQRQEDYTRKTQETARISQEAAKFYESAQQGYTQAISTLETLTQIVQTPMVSEQELLQIALQDPAKAQRIQIEQRLHSKQIEQLNAQKQALKQQQDALALRNGQQYLQQKAQHLLKPETQTAVATYLTTTGYTPQELNELYDPRALIIAEKAMKWDDLQKKRDEVRKSVKPVVEKTMQATGAAPQPKQPRVIQEERQRFRKSGSLRDAAPVFKRFVT
jgi:hypothetical protein